MTHPSMPASGADFDWTAPTGAYAAPPSAASPPDAAEPKAAKHGWLTGMKARMAALIAAGAIVGGGVALAVDHPSSSSSASAGTGQSGAGAAPGGSGGFPGSTSGGTGAGGITPTSYHLSGTITAVNGSTVTIKTSSGSKTYTVTSSTQLRRNGSTVSLSKFQVGDSVVGSTTTSGGSTLNDLMAGMGGMGGDGGTGGPPAGSAPGSSSGSTSGTSSGSTT